MKSRLAALIVLAALAFVVLSRPARAQPPPAELMQRLSVHASGLEAMRKRASFALDGSIEDLDGDGHTDSTKVLKGRVEGDGRKSHFVVIRYLEDGEDKTEDARKKAHEDEQKSDEEREKKQIKMPFLDTQQPRYAFDEIETDPADPARVRISFVPKEPSETTIEGSAWVDTKTATFLSAGFKVSMTPALVEYVHVTIEFGADTSLGPAISKISFEGKGGIPFFKKRFRGSATLGDYRISP